MESSESLTKGSGWKYNHLHDSKEKHANLQFQWQGYQSWNFFGRNIIKLVNSRMQRAECSQEVKDELPNYMNKRDSSR